MTLLLSVFAAVISTAIWYTKLPEDRFNLHVLVFLFWGASIMWFVDAVFEFINDGGIIFNPSLEDLVNDGFLGLSVIALALVIWVVMLLINDPNGS